MVNAQQYLDKNYPIAKRSQLTELDISNKNLEGNLSLEKEGKFPKLLRLNVSFNSLTSIRWDTSNH